MKKLSKFKNDFPITEGRVRKGGINRHPPSEPRPKPPSGQGGVAFKRIRR